MPVVQSLTASQEELLFRRERLRELVNDSDTCLTAMEKKLLADCKAGKIGLLKTYSGLGTDLAFADSFLLRVACASENASTALVAFLLETGKCDCRVMGDLPFQIAAIAQNIEVLITLCNHSDFAGFDDPWFVSDLAADLRISDLVRLASTEAFQRLQDDVRKASLQTFLESSVLNHKNWECVEHLTESFQGLIKLLQLGADPRPPCTAIDDAIRSENEGAFKILLLGGMLYQAQLGLGRLEELTELPGFIEELLERQESLGTAGALEFLRQALSPSSQSFLSSSGS